jgi:hypothetical protein
MRVSRGSGNVMEKEMTPNLWSMREGTPGNAIVNGLYAAEREHAKNGLV